MIDDLIEKKDTYFGIYFQTKDNYIFEIEDNDSRDSDNLNIELNLINKHSKYDNTYL